MWTDLLSFSYKIVAFTSFLLLVLVRCLHAICKTNKNVCFFIIKCPIDGNVLKIMSYFALQVTILQV